MPRGILVSKVWGGEKGEKGKARATNNVNLVVGDQAHTRGTARNLILVLGICETCKSAGLVDGIEGSPSGRGGRETP